MQVTLGDFDVSVDVRDEAVVASSRAPIAPNLSDISAALQSALDQPHHFPPLRRALTPDDRIAVVVDERLPQMGSLIRELLQYVTGAGISPAAITVISAPGSRQLWVDELPDSLQDVRTEIHDPSNRQAVSYLASTRAGRRIYLNRTLVEADQSVVLAGCRYDPITWISDGAGLLFPSLSDAETRNSLSGRLILAASDGSGAKVRVEATEIAWLLGAPFMIQIVEGKGEGIAHIVGGTVESTPECEQRLRDRWQIQFARPAQTVVATMTGDPARHDFETIAKAALNATQVVEPGGRVILLTHATPVLDQAFEIIRDTDEIAVASRRIQERQPAGSTAALLWLEAARNASLYLLSGLPEESVEEAFVTPLQNARQSQRLIESANSCLILEDAHKALAVIKP